jgi:prophage regulatory protein
LRTFFAQIAHLKFFLSAFNNLQKGPIMVHTILRIPAAQTQSGYSRSTIYLRITQGLWPRQISLGPRAVGWPATEIEALNAARISGKTDDEIRALVRQLESARKAAV